MKETEFLRLKRSRLGVHDFEPIKVIGRGAFGEVRTNNFVFVVLKVKILSLQFCFIISLDYLVNVLSFIDIIDIIKYFRFDWFRKKTLGTSMQ